MRGADESPVPRRRSRFWPALIALAQAVAAVWWMTATGAEVQLPESTGLMVVMWVALGPAMWLAHGAQAVRVYVGVAAVLAGLLAVAAVTTNRRLKAAMLWASIAWWLLSGFLAVAILI